MSEKNKNTPEYEAEDCCEEEDYGGVSFEESVRRFADAYFALTEEERQELIEYTQGRCDEAEREYKKRNKKK